MSKELSEYEFLQIYDEYKDSVYNQAYRILGTKEDAEEAAQDVFLRIYKSYESFEGRAKLSSWIYRITFNVCLTKVSQRKKNIDYIEERKDIINSLKEKTKNPEELFQTKEFKELLLQMISVLEPKYSAILTLYYFEEKSYNEISEILNMPKGTIATQLYRAKDTLKDKIIRELYI